MARTCVAVVVDAVVAALLVVHIVVVLVHVVARVASRSGGFLLQSLAKACQRNLVNYAVAERYSDEPKPW